MTAMVTVVGFVLGLGWRHMSTDAWVLCLTIMLIGQGLAWALNDLRGRT